MKAFLIFATLIGIGSALVPSTENCENIPGWTLYSKTPNRNPETLKVSNEVADKNENDLRFRTCCNFKEKCELLVDEFNKGNLAREMCSVVASCNNLDSGTLRIERVHKNGWKSGPYCQNFIENGHGAPMRLCEGTRNCMQNSGSKHDLLTCMNSLFGNTMEHGGFFAEALFPYKSFVYKQRGSGVNIVYELTKDGAILNNGKTFTVGSQGTPPSA